MKITSLIVLCLVIGAVNAADYRMRTTWSDPNAWTDTDYVAYQIQHRINTGIETTDELNLAVGVLPSTSFSRIINASPGDIVEVRFRVKNRINADESPWSDWISTTVPGAP